MTGNPVTRTVKSTIEAYGFGKTKLYELIAEGRVETVKVGRRRLIVDQSVRNLLAQAA